MTDIHTAGVSVVQGPGKRARLVAAARQLLHQQGVERTTIADIATLADVPLGNVYYYFKSKDSIVGAVIDSHVEDIRTELAAIERRHRTPGARLKALIRSLASERKVIAQYGCPHGSLCSELDRRADVADRATGELLRLPINWAEEQFRLMGRADAADLAIHLIATYQGTALLTNTLGDPEIMSRVAIRLGRWIDSLR